MGLPIQSRIDSQVVATIGQDVAKQLDKLSTVKEKMGVFETIKEKINQIIDVFKTGKFTIDDQNCAKLSKQVNKLTKLIEKEEVRMFQKGKDDQVIRDDVKLRQHVHTVTQAMAEILHLVVGKAGKTPGKELHQLSNTLNELHRNNQEALEKGHKKLTPGRVQISDDVAKFGKAHVTKAAGKQLQHESGKETRDAARSFLSFVSALRQEGINPYLKKGEDSKLMNLYQHASGMPTKDLQRNLNEHLSSIKNAMHDRTLDKGVFSPEVEGKFKQIEKVIQSLKAPREMGQKAPAQRALKDSLKKLVSVIDDHDVTIKSHSDKNERSLLLDFAIGIKPLPKQINQLLKFVDDVSMALWHVQDSNGEELATSRDVAAVLHVIENARTTLEEALPKTRGAGIERQLESKQQRGPLPERPTIAQRGKELEATQKAGADAAQRKRDRLGIMQSLSETLASLIANPKTNKFLSELTDSEKTLLTRIVLTDPGKISTDEFRRAVETVRYNLEQSFKMAGSETTPELKEIIENLDNNIDRLKK